MMLVAWWIPNEPYLVIHFGGTDREVNGIEKVLIGQLLCLVNDEPLDLCDGLQSCDLILR